MTDQREKPDFVVDPSGNVRDTRHMRYAFSQGPPSGSPGDSTDGQSSSPSSQKPKRITYLIPIPIGLIIFLLFSLFRHFILPDADVNTFDSESAYNSFQSGNYAFFRGEYDKAIMHYDMALLSESDVGDVYNGRGLAYQAKGDHDRALADFDRALELMPESAMVYNNRALSHHATGDYDQAIADLDKAIALQANFGKAYYNRGLTYHAMGDYDRAIADLTQAVEFSSDWSSSWRALPTRQGSDPGHELLAGLDNQMRAMQIRADLPSVYHNRGLAYFAKGEYDSAISDLDRAISLQPDLSAAYYARGMAYFAGGNYDKAKADCQTMLERGDDPEVQHLAEEVQILCDLVTLGYDVSFPTNGALPTKTARDATAEEPPVPIAIYVPQAHETPVTPKWDHTQASCDGKPFNMWGSPGTYLYKRDGGAFFTITLKSGEAIPSLGVSGPDTLSVAGTVTITTGLGTFQATLLSAGREYSILTGRHDFIKGTYKRSEWYVCGYGLIKLTSSDTGMKTPGNYAYSTSEDLVLLSFTPLTTNESHVRYILADIQLGNVADDYRADVAEEETAEALRCWDAGIRVANIEEFERKIVDGQWQIVYAGTDDPVIGTDIILTSDSPQ
jgi:tetratricopeptide (TPR) repeat protein